MRYEHNMPYLRAPIMPSLLQSVRRLFSFFDKKEQLQLLPVVALTGVVSVLEVITALVVALFAQALVHPERVFQHLQQLHLGGVYSQQRVLLIIAGLCGATYLIKNSIAAFDIYHHNKVIQRLALGIKQRLLSKYSSLSYEEYTSRNSSHMVSMINNEVERLSIYGLVPMSIVFAEGMVFFCLIVFVIWVSPRLSMMVFGVGGVMSYLLVKKVFPYCYRLGANLEESTYATNHYLMQLLYSFKQVILSGREQFFKERFTHQAEKLAKAWSVQNAMQHFPRLAIEFLFISIFVMSIVYLCLTGEPSAHIMMIMGGYLYVASRLMPGLNRMVTHLNNIKSSTSVINTIIDEYQHMNDQKTVQVDRNDFQFRHDICFDHVSFIYKNDQKPILKDINIKINRGECIGIVGGTGTGKSTLIDLLLGFLSPSSGQISIDKKYPVNCRQWHQKIGYVPQSINLLDDTIMANITFGVEEDKVDHKRVVEVVEQAQLLALVNKLPAGLQTRVGERGTKLSGGERQRIAIARALYHNPKVLIFDEATSGLDNETEAAIMQTVYNIAKNHTLIMVAHRITTLKQCNRIFILKEGFIEKAVSYNELVAESISI